MINSIRFITAFLVLTVLSISINAATNTSSQIYLDCSNYRLFNFDLTQKPVNDYTQPITFQTDTLFSVVKDDSSNNSLALWADLGSEVGEPLLIRLERPASNREHLTHGGSQVSLFKNKLQLRGGFHHLGSYSDQLESRFNQISQKHNIYLKHADIGDYGISEYYFGVWKLNLPRLSARGVINKYGNWCLLPIQYDPIYQSGYLYSQDITLSFPTDTIDVLTILNIEKRYWNHYDYSDIKTAHVKATWNHKVSDNLTLGGEVESKSDYAPSILFSLNGESQINQEFSLLFKAGVWDNKEPDGSIGIQWQPLSDLKTDFSIGYNYNPGRKDFLYLSSLDSTLLIVKAAREKQINSSLEIANILKKPVHLRAWTNLKKGYNEYIISERPGNSSIYQSQRDEWFMGIGGKLYADLSIHRFDINPWAQGNLILAGELPEFIPFESGIDIKYTLTGSDPVIVNLSFIYRAPYNWQALKNGEKIELSTNPLLFSNLTITIPFISPIFAEHIKPLFLCQAGPIHLICDKRKKTHPFGNEIGPVISVKIEAAFW